MGKVFAKWNNVIVAEADEAHVLEIEGNKYFPIDSIKKEYFVKSDFHTTCVWKGEASYYNVVVNGEKNENAAWYYPTPKAGSLEIVSQQNDGKYEGDFSNFVAFWRGVEVGVSE